MPDCKIKVRITSDGNGVEPGNFKIRDRDLAGMKERSVTIAIDDTQSFLRAVVPSVICSRCVRSAEGIRIIAGAGRRAVIAKIHGGKHG